MDTGEYQVRINIVFRKAIKVPKKLTNCNHYSAQMNPSWYYINWEIFNFNLSADAAFSGKFPERKKNDVKSQILRSEILNYNHLRGGLYVLCVIKYFWPSGKVSLGSTDMRMSGANRTYFTSPWIREMFETMKVKTGSKLSGLTPGMFEFIFDINIK